MLREEWLLIVFTLLTQLGVGTYIFSVAIRTLNNVNKYVRITMTSLGMTSVGVIMFVAFLFGLIYLRTPMGTEHAILNADQIVRQELLLAAIFIILWVVGFILERNGIWSHLVGWSNSIVGITLILTMATSLYNLKDAPAWSDFNTYLTFICSTIILGAISTIISTLLSKEVKSKQVISILKITGIIGLLSLLFQIAYLPVFTVNLSGLGGAATQSASLLLKNLHITIAYCFLTVGGAAILVYGLFHKAKSKTFYRMSSGPVILVLIGELLGRYVFFVMGVPA